jgi:cysteine synthase
MHTVKDRVVVALIEGAERDGGLVPGGHIVEPTSGSNIAVAARLAARPEHRGKTVVTVACSPGERYLSTALHGAAA